MGAILQSDCPAVLRTYRPRVRLRLFCLPYAGRGASLFRTWERHLPSEVELFPVQIPGRETRLREPAIDCVVRLVETLEASLSPYFDIPFALFGHSMGALVSFELARLLRRYGKCEPVQLFVSGHRAPQVPLERARLHDLPEPALLEQLRQLNGTPDAVLGCSELLRLMLPTLRADLALCEKYEYRPEEPFDFPIAVFGGTKDSTVSESQHAAWRAHTCQSFTLRMFEGDHFFLHSARLPLLLALGQHLRRLLECVDRQKVTHGA